MVVAGRDPQPPRDDGGRLGLNFERVRLRASAHLLSDLREFYDRLETGETELEFAAGEGEPFYHFAFLAPPDRFDELAQGEEVFDFDNWSARAFYFHDPAGNIVEVIAHDVGEGPAHAFAASELLGLSEVGLVSADPPGSAAVLERELGLSLWSGRVPEPGSSALAFIGRKAHTLILTAERRGWMPTGRPAEPHAAEVTLTGAPARSATLPGGPLRVQRVP